MSNAGTGALAWAPLEVAHDKTATRHNKIVASHCCGLSLARSIIDFPLIPTLARGGWPAKSCWGASAGLAPDPVARVNVR
jgi:hypothetical protein